MFSLIEVKKESEEGDEPRAETESESEEELSCFAPTVCIGPTLIYNKHTQVGWVVGWLSGWGVITWL